MGKHACLAHPSALGPGSSPVFSRAPPRLRPSFFSNYGVVDRLRGGYRFLWIFVVPIMFSLCPHQVHNGFPMCLNIGKEGPF
jgi:hypothetical protein